ncbi:unnamed protein product, partial [Heterotrigona itama]
NVRKGVTGRAQIDQSALLMKPSTNVLDHKRRNVHQTWDH